MRHPIILSKVMGMMLLMGLMTAAEMALASQFDVIVNEWSQGNGGNEEWVELLVVNPVDMRGWDLGDSSAGDLTFSDHEMWSSVPSGTLIVIYNGSEKDPPLPPDDTDFTDFVVVIPHNDSTFFDGGWPELANSTKTDNPHLRDASDQTIHNFSTHPSEDVHPGSAKSVAYTNDTNTDSDLAVSDNWTIQDAAEGTVTPGAGNGGSNSAWIDNLRNPDAGIIISEIMYDPDSSDDRWEWIEVCNTTSDAIDLSGYVIDDANGTAHTSPGNIASGSIPGGETAILFNDDDLDASDFEAAWGAGICLIGVTGWGKMELNNSGDKISLWDSFDHYDGDHTAHGHAIDTVDYDASGFPNAERASIYLKDLSADNDDGENWAISAVGEPTPAGVGYASHDTDEDAGENTGKDIGSPGGSFAGPAVTKIHEIQGSDSASPEAGNTHTIRGIVVGDFQDADKGLGGFFVQEEDADADEDTTTSEGIFVYHNSDDVEVGDLVQITGVVDEYETSGSSLTQIKSVTDMTIVRSDNTLPTAASITLPVSDVSDWEHCEGMRISISRRLYMADHYDLGRYGQVTLSSDKRPAHFTCANAPDVEGYANHLAEIGKRRIIVDDGSVELNPDPIIHPRPGLGASNRMRGDYTVRGLTGVLDDRFGAYRIQPTETVRFSPPTPAVIAPPSVDLTLKVASMNLMNYFTTLDGSGDICGPSGDAECWGADTAEEFTRQRDKIISAITGLEADIIGLMELENGTTNTSIQNLVDGINASAGEDAYDFIDTGAIGTNLIRVAMIYRTAAVTPVGDHAILDDTTAPEGTTFFASKNRPSLAQTFQEIATGEMLTVAVAHLVSKRSNCDASPYNDPDLNDGQGTCNLVRTSAANALVTWLETDPTASGDPDFLIIGDMNAYAKEDPITTMTEAGYAALLGPYAYSYLHDGQWGCLDHALSSPGLTPQVANAYVWHINSDESRIFDYNTEDKSEAQISDLYRAESFRASDHDPVKVRLNLSDMPPEVASVTPEDDAGNIAVNTDIAIRFNEPVNVTGDWFRIVGTDSGTQNVDNTVVSGGPKNWIIRPNANFTYGETITITLFAAQITDQDGTSDNMASDHHWTFDVYAPDLFISEYVEGEGNDKAIELYNNTGDTIDLGSGNYVIEFYFNGDSSPNKTVELTGTIADNDVFVFANPLASFLPANDGDISADQVDANSIWYDGNDAVILRKDDTILDVIGQVGFDPGAESEWGSGLTSTKDNTLRRKPAICDGDRNPDDSFEPADEWDGFENNTFDGLGKHTSVCAPPNAPDMDADGVSETRIDLTWTDTSDNEDGFRIERSVPDSDDWTVIAQVTANTTAYSDTGLTCETMYAYRIMAYNTRGDSAYSSTANADTRACGSDVPPVSNACTAIRLSKTTVAENQPAGTFVGTLSATDPDPGDTHTFYRVVSPNGWLHNSSFVLERDGAGGPNFEGDTLVTANVFDHEGQNDYTIYVRCNDNTGASCFSKFTITVTNVNEPPADIVLSHRWIDEASPPGTKVGDLTVTGDPDAGDTHTCNLVSGKGDDDNGLFIIKDNVLMAAGTFDYETEARHTYNVRVRAADKGGLRLDKSFTVTVKDMNEAPADIVLNGASVNENSGATQVGTFSTHDPNSGDTHSYALVSGEGDADNDAFRIVGDTLHTQTCFNYENPENRNTRSIRVLTDDGHGGTFEKSFGITVNNVNEGPCVSDIGNQTADVASLGDRGDITASFTLTDPDTPVNELTLSAVSDNPALLPGENMVFGGSDTARSITLTPTPGMSGQAIVIVTVGDGELTAETSFSLVVILGPVFEQVSVTLAHDPDMPISPGSTLSYTAVIPNTGDRDAEAVAFLLSIPENTAYVRGSAKAHISDVRHKEVFELLGETPLSESEALEISEDVSLPEYDGDLSQIKWTGGIPAGREVRICFDATVSQDARSGDVISAPLWTMTYDSDGGEVSAITLESDDMSDAADCPFLDLTIPEPEHPEGDVNGDGAADLEDAIRILQILAGARTNTVHLCADANDDQKIGTEELIFVLRRLSASDNP